MIINQSIYDNLLRTQNNIIIYWHKKCYHVISYAMVILCLYGHIFGYFIHDMNSLRYVVYFYVESNVVEIL